MMDVHAYLNVIPGMEGFLVLLLFFVLLNTLSFFKSTVSFLYLIFLFFLISLREIKLKLSVLSVLEWNNLILFPDFFFNPYAVEYFTATSISFPH